LIKDPEVNFIKVVNDQSLINNISTTA